MENSTLLKAVAMHLSLSYKVNVLCALSLLEKKPPKNKSKQTNKQTKTHSLGFDVRIMAINNEIKI